MQISQNFQDPNVYAQQYANENNISLDEAKSQLKAKYGDPSQASIFQNSGNNYQSTTDPIGNDIDNVFANAGADQVNNLAETLTTLITELISAIKDLLSSLTTEDEDEDVKEDAGTSKVEDKTTDTTKNTSDNTKKSSGKKSSSSSNKTTSGSKNEAKTNQPNAQQADNEVKEYARHHGCTEAEARAALKNLFGNPAGYEGS